MKKLRKRKGASLIMVVGTLMFVSLVAALTLSSVNHTIYQTQTYSLQMQAQYINKAVADAAVQALAADDNALLTPLTDEDSATAFEIDPEAFEYFEYHDEMTNELLGVNKINAKVKTYLYYGEPKPWVEIEIVTTIPDTRTARAGEASDAFAGTVLAGTKGFEYTGTMVVLAENPLIHIYNPDSSLMATAAEAPVIPVAPEEP